MISPATAASSNDAAASAPEQPQNGVAGLKHWRYDVVAGLLVSLVSLPLSLGIAVASGAPPVVGLISSIIAGLLMPFLGGTYVTISGPAAGLAPALLAAMIALGHGNLQVGYPLLLVVICITGCVQIVLSKLRAARYSALFPAAVVEGMLASIGLLIIAKQLPNIMGHSFHAHEFFEFWRELPSQIPHAVPQVLGLGIACLVAMFLWNALPFRFCKTVPAPLAVVVFGIGLGQALGIDEKFLIHVPENIFSHGLVLPNFSGVFTDSTLWWAAATAVLTLTLIDGVESLATATAIDRIDPFRRKSNPDRVLLAMGVSNICSSLIGGLTIIPGGVKSKVCILAGGRTLWANFFNAIFLLIFLFLAHNLINLIPLAALGAILIFTGYKMCEPRIWLHLAKIGPEQLVVFAVTIVATLASDLLIGIGVGMLAKFVLAAIFVCPATATPASESAELPRGAFGLARRALSLFRNPVARQETDDTARHVYLSGPVVCFNAHHVARELKQIPIEHRDLVLHITPQVPLIDHTSCDSLLSFVQRYRQTGCGQAEIVGLDHMWSRSSHPAAMRRAERASSRLASVVVAQPIVPTAGFSVELDPLGLANSAGKALDAGRVDATERCDDAAPHSR